jgi:two-component system chemotaxis response regulator CheY
MGKGLKSVLEGMNFEVVGIGCDGFEGLDLFERLSPDVTMMDITMPNMDGIECLQRIRAVDPNARVVMLSAIQDPDTIERCLSLGAHGFLQKPIRPGSPSDLFRLCETIESAVEKVTQ